MSNATEDKELAAEARDRKVKEEHQGVRTSGGQIARLQITTFSELENLAMILGKSDLVPKDMIGKPANILLGMMFGNEIGLTPAQALQNVMVVNGRPTLWGDATMGLVENSGLQDWWKDEYLPTLNGGTWRFTTKRRGREPVTREFSMDDARTAGLAKKEGPWQLYPKRMLFHRARSWALRDVYPDVLKGIRYYEEERDVIETTATAAQSYELPKERAQGTTASAPAAEAPTAAAPAAAPGTAPKDEFKQEAFRVGGGATTEFEGDPDCYLVRDDAETPTKYYHKNADWHAMAKAAKDAKAYVTATWIEKPSKKGPVRWLVGLSLKS